MLDACASPAATAGDRANGARQPETKARNTSTDNAVCVLIPEPSSTVMLVRGSDDAPLEVFMQSRVASMAFAASYTVFPGGKVDPADLLAASNIVDSEPAAVPDQSGWQGPSAREWAQRFGVEETAAAALVLAAIRELFEETGVLLASERGAAALVSPSDIPAQWRETIEVRDSSLPELLGARQWILRTDLLYAWDRWVTPEGFPRRYDTAFFLAEMPKNQFADDATTEAERAQWVEPAAALRQWQCGELELLHPTWFQLRRLAQCNSVEQARSQGVELAGAIVATTPVVQGSGPTARVLAPDADRYYAQLADRNTGDDSAGDYT